MTEINWDELWKWFEERFGEDAMNRYYGYETEELVEEAIHRYHCKRLEDFEKRLENLEKEINRLIEYVMFRMHNYEVKTTPDISTGEKEPPVFSGVGMWVYKGWFIEYVDDNGTVSNPHWIATKGSRSLWLNGSLSFEDVKKVIDGAEGGRR